MRAPPGNELCGWLDWYKRIPFVSLSTAWRTWKMARSSELYVCEWRRNTKDFCGRSAMIGPTTRALCLQNAKHLELWIWKLLWVDNQILLLNQSLKIFKTLTTMFVVKMFKKQPNSWVIAVQQDGMSYIKSWYFQAA